MRMATPSPTTFESTRRRGFLPLVSPKRRLPLPSTIGYTINRSSSTRSCSSNVCTSRALPATRMTPSTCSFNLPTSSATSPLSTVELFHSAFSKVDETTYLGMLFIFSAKPTSSATEGQASAKPSYVTRPSSWASASRTSSNLNLSPSSPRLTSKLQPPCSKPSAPPGSSMTPSSDTNSVTTIRPISPPCSLAFEPGTILNQKVEYVAADALTSTFAALADPTRRAILARLAEGEATVNELAEPFPISVQAVSKHLKVLERAGLIMRGRSAQLRPSRLQGAPLEEAAEWLEEYRRFWQGSFDRLDERVRATKNG